MNDEDKVQTQNLYSNSMLKITHHLSQKLKLKENN